jgi:CHC2 zinc finger
MRGAARAKTGRRPLSCEDVALAALGSPLKRSGAEIYFLCPLHPDTNPSLQINVKKNCWSCFPCGAGGNAWTLVAFLLHIEPGNKPAIARWLRERGLLDGSSKVMSIHIHAVNSGGSSASARTRSTRTDEIYYSDNLRKVRLEPGKEGRDKDFVWEHRAGDRWRSRLGGLEIPLYANTIFWERDLLDVVIGTEGERKCDLLGELDLAGFSFKELAAKDCPCFGDLDVVLWPDKDTSGKSQVTAKAKLLLESRQPRCIRIITPPAELPEKGDIVDAIEKLGWGREQILKLAAEAKPFDFREPWAPTEVRTPARAGTPRRKSPLKCFFDFRKLPLETFRLAEDKRKVKHLWLERRTIAIELAGYANADGTQIHVSAETIVAHTGLSRATVFRRLDDLTALGILESKHRGFNQSAARTLRIPSPPSPPSRPPGEHP